MAPPRTQCLMTAGRIFQRPLELRASFSSSAVVRADGPSRTIAADGLPASLDENRTSQPRFSSRDHLPRSNRLPAGSDAHTPTRTSNQRIGSLVSESLARRARHAQNLRKPGQPSLTTVQEIENAKKASDLSRQITRRWRVGDVYAPHDLSPVEMDKWRVRSSPKYDIFDVLGFKPLESYKNFSIMSEYMSSTGRIRHPKLTGLRPVNQRKIAKAVRRSIGLGLMPSVYHHPELLQKIALKQEQNPTRKM